MRIVHLLNTSSFSGAENVAIQIIENSGEQNEAYYCSPQGKIGEILQKRGVRYLPVRKLCVKEIRRIIREIKPDVIHAHDFRAGLLAILASKKRVPVVSHLHNNCPWLKKIGVKSLLFRYIAAKCSVLLTVSESVMDEFVFGKRFADKTVVIGNPIDVKRIQRNIGPGAAIEYDLVFCGRLMEQKNPGLFLEIVKRLSSAFPRLRAIMLGDGVLRTEVEETIGRLGLENTVTVAGFVDDPVSYMARSRVLVITSSWEGFGLVAVEALAAGKPVVASNVGGLPSIVNDRCGALCNSTDDFVVALSQLLSDDGYYSSKCSGALSRADELNNLEQYMQNINQAYGYALRKK